ncbi:hypothetical protein C8T65DRAFT_830866 [Cerioporus squamosus]|nr:hypothetical protein C8T65DRAFT_830866 [Cerioporus squamosus]
MRTSLSRRARKPLPLMLRMSSVLLPPLRLPLATQTPFPRPLLLDRSRLPTRSHSRPRQQQLLPSGKTSDAEKEMTRTLRMAWAFAEIVMEIKNSDDSSPFCWTKTVSFHGPRTGPEPRRARRVRYGGVSSQHRLSLFAIAIAGATAVLVRFDRNGAVVSEAFNYFTSSTELGNLFYRLFRKRQSDLSIPRELRGHDPTAEPACESCTALFRGLHRTRLPEFDPVAIAGLEKAAKKGWPIYCLSIKSPWSPDGIAVRPDDPVETHRVLVGRPLFSSLSMMGRGTRGFVGWDLDADRPVFVKDSWRTESPSRHSELEIYHRLWDGEESQSVYMGLSKHINAPGRGRFLHRDISVNNILIMGSRGDTVGLLCDWDLAKTEQQLEDSNPTRAGTWQYMSALRQRFVEKRHTSCQMIWSPSCTSSPEQRAILHADLSERRDNLEHPAA